MVTVVQTWTCKVCGQQAKATWRYCAVCEALEDGQRREDLAQRPTAPDESLLPGVILLIGLTVVLVAGLMFRSEVWRLVVGLFG